jgi:lipopolysaccharide biosynthesis glycosyltransferase
MAYSNKVLITVITEGYKEYLFTFLSSIKKNLNGTYSLIIINDGLLEATIAHIEEIMRGHLDISFYNIYESKFKDIFVGDIKTPVYWRLIAPLIVENKSQQILYIDADTLVRSNIDELFTYDLNGAIVGAVVDYLGKIMKGVSNYKILKLEGEMPYFNAGVLLINPRKYIENNIMFKVIEIVKSNSDFLIADGKWPQDDQYGLNVALYKNWVILPPKYNYGSELPFNPSAKIVHFIGNGKPKSPTCNPDFKKEFLLYKNSVT